MKLLVYFFLVQISLVACSQDCKQLPSQFNSYNDAVAKVRSASFKYKDDVSTSNSSWIRSISYYSCDGNTGFLIYSTNKGKDYIHQGVPIEIWKEFKKAESAGGYYNENIKGRYPLKL